MTKFKRVEDLPFVKDNMHTCAHDYCKTLISKKNQYCLECQFRAGRGGRK